MDGFVDTIDLQALHAKGRHLTQIDKRFILLLSVGDAIFAIDELCPHRAGPLSEGRLEGHTIHCPWHDAQFDVRNGKVLSGPSARNLRTYETLVVGSRVFVKLPA